MVCFLWILSILHLLRGAACRSFALTHRNQVNTEHSCVDFCNVIAHLVDQLCTTTLHKHRSHSLTLENTSLSSIIMQFKSKHFSAALCWSVYLFSPEEWNIVSSHSIYNTLSRQSTDCHLSIYHLWRDCHKMLYMILWFLVMSKLQFTYL